MLDRILCFTLLLFIGVPIPAQDFINDSDYELSIYEYRQKYFDEYLKDPRAPYSPEDTVHIHFYEPDINWAVTASFKAEESPKPFDMALYSGATRKFIKFGTLQFRISGNSYTLAVYSDITRVSPLTSHKLFLPFMDDTNGGETYGGGRYLDLSKKDINPDGSILIDFNKSYNPWCAYSDGFNCPIPPKENHLPIPILAGEKQYTKNQ